MFYPGFMGDELDGGGSVQGHEILLPEIRLGAPICLGKLVAIQEYSGIDFGLQLIDDSIVQNIRRKRARGKFGRHMISDAAVVLRDAIHLKFPSLEGFKPMDPHRFIIRSKTHWDPEVAKISNTNIDIAMRELCNFSAEHNDWVKELWKTWRIESCQDPYQTTERVKQNYSKSLYRGPFSCWNQVRKTLRSEIHKFESKQASSLKTSHPFEMSRWTLFFSCCAVVIFDRKSKVYSIFDLNLVLMAVDVFESRFVIDILSEGREEQRVLSYSNGLRGNIRRIWEIGDEILTEVGTGGFKLIGLVESLIVGSIEAKGDLLSETQFDFLESQITEALEICTEIGLSEDKALSFIFELTEGSQEDCAEKMCLFRTWGHPPLESAPAAGKIRKYMCQTKFLELSFLVEESLYFKRELINGHLKDSGGMWPPVTIPIWAIETRGLRNSGKPIPPVITGNLRDELRCVTIDKIDDISLDEVISIYLKDKAISGPASCYDSTFQFCGMSYRPASCKYTKRLVAYFLEQEDFDPEQYIEHIESGQYLLNRESYLSYSLKEREIKETARIFGKMDAETRGAQVLGEHMVAVGLAKYQDANTMVMKETQFLKRAAMMTGHSVVADQVAGTYPQSAAFVNLDIVKYCLAQRFEANQLIFKVMDGALGLRDFFQWHHLYMGTRTACVTDPFCPPNQDFHIPLEQQENTGIFIKHPAGAVEGYQQKAWTMISITDLNIASIRLGVEIQAMAQGDNQTVAVTVKNPRDRSVQECKLAALEEAIRYKYVLQDILIRKGQELKLAETFVSPDLFVYSKRIYKNARLLPQSLKGGITMKLWGDKIVDEVRSGLTNISNGTFKFIAQGGDIRAGLALGKLRSYEQILAMTNMSLNKLAKTELVTKIQAEHGYLQKMCSVPLTIGGYDYLPLQKVVMRNPGDPLTTSIAELKKKISLGMISASEAIQFFNQTPEEPNWRHLGLDPYGLSFRSVTSISGVLQRITAKSVLAKSPNPMLKGLFKGDYEEEDERLAMAILDNTRIYPRAAKAILDETPTGERMKLCKMCDTTKTVIMQASTKGGIDFMDYSLIKRFDSSQIEWFDLVISGHRVEPFTEEDVKECSVDLSRRLRSYSWKELIGERVLEGLDVAPMLECTLGRFIEAGEACGQCQIQNRDYALFQLPEGTTIESNNDFKRAIRAPYVGSSTLELTRLSLINVKELSRPVRKGARMATLIIWLFGDNDEAWTLASQFANLRFPCTVEELKLITSRHAAGNLLHRLHDNDTATGFVGMKESAFSPYIQMSTDFLATLEDLGSEDTNFIYQNALHIGIFACEERARSMGMTLRDEILYHLHVKSGCCVREQVYTPLTDFSGALYVTPEPLKENPFIYDKRGLGNLDSQFENIKFLKETALELKELDSADVSRLMGLTVGKFIMTGIISASRRGEYGNLDSGPMDADIGGLISECAATRITNVFEGMAIEMACALAPEALISGCTTGAELLNFVRCRLRNIPYKSYSKLSSILSSKKVREKEGNVYPRGGGPNQRGMWTYPEIQGRILLAFEAILENPEKIFDVPVISDRLENLDVHIRRKEIGMMSLIIVDKTSVDTKVIREIFGTGQETVVPKMKRLIAPELLKNCVTPRVVPGNLTYVVRQCLLILRERNFSLDEVRVRNVVYENMALDDDKAETTENIAGYDLMEGELWPHKDEMDLRTYLIRNVGRNSSAASKLLDTLACLPIKGEKVLCLGEGAGSLAAVFKSLEAHTIYFNSLQMGKFGAHRVPDYFPSEYYNVHGEKDLIVLTNGRASSTDLTTDECLELIISSVPDCGIITCDAEGGSSSATIWRSVMQITQISGKEGCTLICKILLSLPECTSILRWSCERFRDVRLMRSPYSTLGNSEFYLVAKGYHKGISIPRGPKRAEELSLDCREVYLRCKAKQEVLLEGTDSVLLPRNNYLLRKLGWSNSEQLRKEALGNLGDMENVPSHSLSREILGLHGTGGWARRQSTRVREEVTLRVRDMVIQRFMNSSRSEILEHKRISVMMRTVSASEFLRDLTPRLRGKLTMPDKMVIEFPVALEKILFKCFKN